MSLIGNCLARLVAAGRVSQKAAADALALHEGMQGRLGREMDPTTADALGALEAARVMAAAAQERKLSIAKQAIAAKAAGDQMRAHPKGTVAGLLGLLTRDIYDTGTENVDRLAEAIYGRLHGMFSVGNERLGSKIAGLVQNRGLARQVVRELFGEDAGSDTAKQIAKAWREATGYAVDRAKRAGKVFHVLDDWRVPQFWQGARVRHFGEAEFASDIERAMQTGGLRVLDRQTGLDATPMRLPLVLKAAFEDIVHGGGKGGGGAFNPEMRVFRFTEGKAGADAWLALQGKYGPGDDLYGLMVGHLRAASQDIALTEKLGPDPRATFRALLDEARRDERTGKAKRIAFLSSARTAEKTFDQLTGEANVVQSEALAGVFSGVRGWLTAVQLSGATLSAVPGDSATTLLAARWNGLSAARVIAGAVESMVADTAGKRAAAARLGIVAHASAETVLTHGRFAGEWLDPNIAGKVATTVLRANGLIPWSEGVKRAFTMEMLGLIADNTGRRLDAVDGPLRAFLQRYGISAADWDTLRAAPLLDVDGARFFDVWGIEDHRLADRLMAGIMSERGFALIEPDARTRAIFAVGGGQRGTLWGEIGRSPGMYRSFSLSIALSHGMRAATQTDLTSKAAYGAALLATTTVAGAATIAARDIVYGRDPRPMGSKAFWLASMIQGGGLGIFGDFAFAGFNRADKGVSATLMGPMVGLADDLGTLIFPPVRKLAEGEEADFGTALARQVRRYASPIPFYARLAADRLLFDQFQAAIDPNYRASFRRQEDMMKRNYGSSFWWRPGETAPGRAPDLGNMIQ